MGPQCRELISHADEAFISAVTPWELGIKRALGKLTMPDGLVDELESEGFVPLPIAAAHAESSTFTGLARDSAARPEPRPRQW